LIENLLNKIKKEMLKTSSILSENFLNEVQTAYTLHAKISASEMTYIVSSGA